jgi:pyrroloquinoline quinone biosynthesis protein E
MSGNGHEGGRGRDRALGGGPGLDSDLGLDFDLDQPLALSPHAAVKVRAEGELLVLPERALRLGGSGGEILRLVGSGQTGPIGPTGLAGVGGVAGATGLAGSAGRSGAAIVEAMRGRYPDEAESVASEIVRFLAEMIEIGGIVFGAGGEDARDAGTTAAGAMTREVQGVREARAPTARRARHALRPGAPTPLNLIAELTYRCPLRCPYCSNPLDFRERREGLSAADWGRVFEQAAAIGVVHVGLTGGEPSVRSDLEEIVERAVAADLSPHLVTAGRPLDPERLGRLAALGLRSVQVSIQDATAAASDRIAGVASFEDKLAICERTRVLGLALTVNCVLHRHNLESVPELIALARRLGADRLELANTQYHGWALRNRAALMPTREQLERAAEAVRRAEDEIRRATAGATARTAGAAMPGAAHPRADLGRPSILFVRPDYYSERPKPCMGGWGRLAMVVDPTGRLLPCHDAGTIPGLEFWNVRKHPVEACWAEAPGMQAFRGTEWMAEPCRSCPERETDFGGCRCQAFALLGDAGATDPACALSPEHGRIVAGRGVGRDGGGEGDASFAYRGQSQGLSSSRSRE